MYETIFEFVKATLKTSGGEECRRHYRFRLRSEHSWRVFSWAKRLLAEIDAEVNREAVLTAAILHDIGHGVEDRAHAENGAGLCRAYLKEKGFEPEFVDFVTYLVENHSKKKLLFEKKTPLELIILMEADLLDETGALSIIWDAMAEGGEEEQSFLKTLKRIEKYSARVLDVNPMQTAAAKRLWAEKQRLAREFIRALYVDLGVAYDRDQEKNENLHLMVVEQTRDCKNRMKCDPASNVFHEAGVQSLARYSNVPYPYGWLKESGEPHLDVILISTADYKLGDEVAVRIVGCFVRGGEDHKMVAVLPERPETDYFELPGEERETLRRLYPRISPGEGWFGIETAKQVISAFMARRL